jgi:hypothetical protein
MKVIDSEGSEVGTADLVKMGDPNAVTAQGQDPPASGAVTIPGVAVVAPAVPGGMPGGVGGPGVTGGLVAPAAAGVGAGEPDVGPALAERLLRTGYIKVDSKGWFHRDVYASAEQIDQVAGDEVHLTVPKTNLTTEA